MRDSSRRGWKRFSIAAPLVAACCFALAPRPAAAQIQSIPSPLYYSAFGAYNAGNFGDALVGFRDAGLGAVKGANGRWIDSICYHCMIGECYYQLGNYPLALQQHRLALQQYLQYPNWMVRVSWPQTIRPFSGQVRIPWGVTKRRGARPGQFNQSYQITLGGIQQIPGSKAALNNAQVVPLDATEIVRCLAMSIRRYRELLGPTSAFDTVLGSVIGHLANRPTTPNHWSESWIDVLLGVANSAAGKTGDAKAFLKRGVVTAGRFDHPLSGVALLELGYIALHEGDFASATNYFEEATYSIAYFADTIGVEVLEQAFRLATVANILANRQQPLTPLAAATLWARKNGTQYLYASLALSAAEDLAYLGQTPAALKSLALARPLIATKEMVVGRVAARYHHIRAMIQYQAGNVVDGDLGIATALGFQKTHGSLALFHIALVDKLFLSGYFSSPRAAEALFETVLRDPTAFDWRMDPLESLSALSLTPVAPMEHWFEVALLRKDKERALEITDMIRRRRFYSALTFGGRLLSLRWLLEGPDEALDPPALLLRRDILIQYPQYGQLSQRVGQLRAELTALPLTPDDEARQKAQREKLAELQKISLVQEGVLRQIAVRREPAPLVFPPLRKTKDVLAAMPDGQWLLVFYTTTSLPTNSLYAFMLGKDDQRLSYEVWRVARPDLLYKNLKAMLRDMGNIENNREVPLKELQSSNWKASARGVYDEMFRGVKLGIPTNASELVIVPDGALWYLPFEALQTPTPDGGSQPLISQTRVRYVPTVSLATPDKRGRKLLGTTAIVSGKLFPREEAGTSDAAFDDLASTAPNVVKLPAQLPAPSAVYSILFDRLVVLDDIASMEAAPVQWAPVAGSKGPGSTLESWLPLPWGGPDQVILPGFHTPAENALKRESAAMAGTDVFLSACAMMATGTRTMLISRWRTGGKTSYDLVREFTQELPYMTASEAWRRSVFLARDEKISLVQEPRVSSTARDAPPTASNPFFWAGYVLIDTGSHPQQRDDGDVAGKKAEN